MSFARVSVLMCVFNAEPFVHLAIDSVLSQTLPDLELIVVDDGSTDGSWEIIAGTADRDPRVVPIRLAGQGGASHALNQGLARARGAFITRQDSDDISEPTRLAEQVAFLEAHPEIGAVGTAVLMIDGLGVSGTTATFPGSDSEIQELLLDQMCFCGPTVMVRRQVLENAGYRFDEALSGSEDYDLCLRLAEIARLANLPQPLYRYRQHASSVTYTQRSRQLCRKAVAVEQALLRRFGAAAPAAQVAIVARDYFRAAVVAHRSGDGQQVEQCLRQAEQANPGLLADTELLGDVLGRYTAGSPIHVAMAFTDSFVREHLPRTWPIHRLRKRLAARLHVRELLSAAEQGQTDAVRRHFWTALRLDPATVATRRVLAAAAQHFCPRQNRRSATMA